LENSSYRWLEKRPADQIALSRTTFWTSDDQRFTRDVLGQARRAAGTGGLVDLASFCEHTEVVLAVPLVERHEADGAVQELGVVPADEPLDPCPGRVARSERLARVRR
jgi:hypothetical protein